MNKIIFLLVLVVLIASISIGCSSNKIEFEGVENKKLTKDLIRLRSLIIDSIKEKKYKEDEIKAMLDKINDKKYQEKLNATEILLINHINDIKEDIKYDLSNGNKLLTSTTYEEINWLLQATDEKPE